MQIFNQIYICKSENLLYANVKIYIESYNCIVIFRCGIVVENMSYNFFVDASGIDDHTTIS